MAERQWTPAQKNAIEADSGTVLVSAAAGSGKTSVLVERIVRKLTSAQNSVPPESLLVVTFTNAAAAEMRSRIYSGISSKISSEPERKSEYISLLSKLGEMQICTMDSFCLNLVRLNCHLLGIESDFRILENAESLSLKGKAASSVCERRFSEHSDTFIPLARMFESGKNDANLIKTIIRFSDFSMSEPVPEKWLRSVAECFRECSAADSVWGKCICDNVLRAFEYCFTLLEGAYRNISEDEELEAKMSSFLNTDRDILENALNVFKKSDWDGKYSALKRARELFSLNRFPRLPKAYSDSPVKNAVKAKRDEYKSTVEDMLGLMCCSEQENAEDIAVLRPVAEELVLSVIEYNELLLEMKKEMNAFSFSDISHFALSLLIDEGAPDGKTPLARELSDFYSEILIDEYQDTNRAQDTLFRTISKNGLNMFFVGDVKQSIYRFRLASPEIFIDKCSRFPYYDGKAPESKIILSENFRSRKGILDGVNYVFSLLMTPRCGEIEYNEDEKLHFPSALTPEKSCDVHYTVLECEDKKASVREAEYIASVIKDKLKNGFVGSGEAKRKPVPSDFCILLRAKADIMQSFSDGLKNAGLPVSADSADSFFDSPEIMTMVSYLRCIDNPLRDTDLLAVMLSPVFGFTPDDAAVLRLKYGRKGSLIAAVIKASEDKDAKCQALLERLDCYKKFAACLSVDMLLREIYSDTSYLYVACAMSDGERRRKNLLRLLETAEKTSEIYPSLGGFVKYLELMRENEGLPGENGSSDGVRIMTMHKSKGLEFPFVFIAGASKQFNRTDVNAGLVISHTNGLGIKRKEPENIKLYHTLSSKAVQREILSESMSEELRVCYVALTRAKQELYIVSAMKNARTRIEKTEYLLYGIDGVPSYLVGNATSSSLWFLYCFLGHPDARSLRGVFPSKVKPKGEIDISFMEEEPEDAGFVCAEEVASADEETVELIREKASFVYRWADISSALSKHTASSLRDEHFDAAGFGKSVPSFMFSSALSPADIGTATHKFLQYCDFLRCREFIDSERQRLVKEGRLTEKQAQAVDAEAITVFVNSSVMKRALASDTMLREKQFTIAKSICELDAGIPPEFSDEKTVVIGKIDLLFTEKEGAVIVDYKTDNINDINILADRYRSQMLLYIEAVEKSMGLRVKECILYSLKLKDSISLVF